MNSHSESAFSRKFRCDNFDINTCNRDAYEAVFSEDLLDQPLLIYGQHNTGKTHLLHAYGHFIEENEPEASILYATTEEYCNGLMTAFRVSHKELVRWRESYRNQDILLLDDVDFIFDKQMTTEELRFTLKHLMLTDKRIIATSHFDFTNMDDVDADFRAVFENWKRIKIRKKVVN